MTWVTNTFGNDSNPKSAQMRLDCVAANGESLANTACVPTTTVVPLPAPILLLLGGIGVLGIAGRRRKDGVMV